MRKKKRHKPSILHSKNGTCYLCMMEGNYRRYPVLHKHHIFSGPANRKISEAEGLYCWLCPEHHEFSKAAVHQNAANMLYLRQETEREYEKRHGREEFYRLFRRYYVEEER